MEATEEMLSQELHNAPIPLLSIGGFIPLSTTDYPGKLSAVLFCQGCPWQCRYCHNTHLIPPSAVGEYGWEGIFSFLKKRVGLLDSVVFSGGEPTMQPAISNAIEQIHDLGFAIGLHTAGQYPERLKQIVANLSWIGMDIKAPFGKYQAVTGRPEQRAKILASIRTVIESVPEYEFRTTFHPTLLSTEDLLSIGRTLGALGAKRYVIQHFRTEGCTDEMLNNEHHRLRLDDTAALLRDEIEHVELRG